MIDKVKLIPLNVVIVFVAVDDGAVILGDVPQLICLKPEPETCFRKVLFKKKSVLPFRTHPEDIALVSVKLEEFLWDDFLVHLVEDPALNCPVNHLPHPAQRAVTLDGAPGAAGPDLQEAGGAGRLGGTGPHSDPQVFSLLQLRVEKAALRLNAVPGAEIIN